MTTHARLFQNNEIESCIAATPMEQQIRSKRRSNHKVESTMSVDATKEDFWQATARSTIRERCEAIFNKELLSDVKFVVRDSQGGSESKMVPAHKFVLAISSPVFHAMFFGELADTKDSVEISDCDFESLLEMFRFIYSDEANLSPNNVMQLLYLAKKYMLPSLADKCSAYLQENVDASNVFYVLSDAQKYEEKDLLHHCWKVIKKETEEAVKSDGFETIERTVLEELVEKDELNIKEVELFKAVDCWATKRCEKQGLVAEGTVKRRIIGERIVKGIRFPLMEQKEFAHVVLNSEILTHKETNHMMKYFSSVLNVPVEFSEAKRSGRLKKRSQPFMPVRGPSKPLWQYPSPIHPTGTPQQPWVFCQHPAPPSPSRVVPPQSQSAPLLPSRRTAPVPEREVPQCPVCKVLLPPSVNRDEHVNSHFD